MIKLVYCITRKDGMSVEEFRRTWLEDHGPLVKSHAEAIGAVHYTQSHTILDDINAGFQAARGCEPQYDGITEVWWNTREDMEAGFASEAGRDAGIALIKDESRFIEFSKCRVFMTQEHKIF